MSNGKVMIILLIIGLIKKALYKTSQYFPTPYKTYTRKEYILEEKLMSTFIWLAMHKNIL